MGTIVVFGGRSEIGVATAVRLAAGHRVVLAARRSGDLADETAALIEAGATEVVAVEFDADDVTAHGPLVAALVADYGPIDLAVVAFGILGDAARAETDVEHALAIAHTDYYAQISVITLLANALRAQGSGTIIVFSSVAGVRVRRANYVYGSAKAGLDGFLQGMQDRLHGGPVQLTIARPGFVIGRMTEGMKPAPMSSTPAQVAEAAVTALDGRKLDAWIPARLGFLARATRFTPRSIWRKMPR